jgi:hypothetical protein
MRAGPPNSNNGSESPASPGFFMRGDLLDVSTRFCRDTPKAPPSLVLIGFMLAVMCSF